MQIIADFIIQRQLIHFKCSLNVQIKCRMCAVYTPNIRVCVMFLCINDIIGSSIYSEARKQPSLLQISLRHPWKSSGQCVQFESCTDLALSWVSVWHWDEETGNA